MNKFGTQDRFSRFGQIKRVGKLGKYGASFYTRINSGNVNIGPQSSPPTSFGGPPAGGLSLTGVVEPTESNTGYRLDTTALTLWTGESKFKDEGHPGSDYQSVPAGGLTITGYLFDREAIKVYAENELHFVDCYFSGAPRALDMNSYHLQTLQNAGNGSYKPNAGRKMTVEHCTFYGGADSAMIYAQFKSVKKCSFNWAVNDYIKPHTHTEVRNVHDFLVEECWFGPHVNMADGPLNGGNGMFAAGTIPNPHADNLQVRWSDPKSITYRLCSIDWTQKQWTDGTVNPNNNLGANPDKILQLDGGVNVPTSLDLFVFDRCWIYGAGNTWSYFGNNPPKNVFGWWRNFEIRFFGNIIALDANGGGWNTDFDSDPNSGNFMNYTRVTDGNNKFMRTNSESLRLPPEATSAGTQVTHSGGGQSDIFSCENWLLGLDSVTFYHTGLNEGGRTSFDRRSTPV